MRFGIFVISEMRPKLLRTRLRPVNDCVIAVLVNPIFYSSNHVQTPPPAAPREQRVGDGRCRWCVNNYFSSTFAPASSSFFLRASASDLLRPSLTAFGAASTRALASLRPSPVVAGPSLVTLFFLSGFPAVGMAVNPERKSDVIKEVRAITGLGLKEAKD